MNTLSSINDESNLDHVIKANTQLMHLSDDFVYAARTFGRIIISEVFFFFLIYFSFFFVVIIPILFQNLPPIPKLKPFLLPL